MKKVVTAGLPRHPTGGADNAVHVCVPNQRVDTLRNAVCATPTSEKGIPSSCLVRLPRANHYVFLSNEADVLCEMNAFLASLP